MAQHINILAFAPHPDDAELYCSGILLAAKHAGQTTGIIDLTRGELSTRGNPELRQKETATASAILQLDVRDNLDIPDGDVANTLENRGKVVSVLRRYTPDVVLIPYYEDRHPDHMHTSVLVRDALFFGGVAKLNPGGEDLPPHRPKRAYYYQMTNDFEPQILVDISPFFETKMAAIGAYASQFFVGDVAGDEEQETYISSKGFMEAIVARSRRLGFLVGAQHAEGLRLTGPVGVDAETLMRI